jgi:hypothetical protein
LAELANIGAYVFGEDELGDILEDHGFVSVRTKSLGTIQWVRGKRGRHCGASLAEFCRPAAGIVVREQGNPILGCRPRRQLLLVKR